MAQSGISSGVAIVGDFTIPRPWRVWAVRDAGMDTVSATSQRAVHTVEAVRANDVIVHKSGHSCWFRLLCS